MEVFFSRPGKKEEIKDRLITDIKYAKKRLLVSVYSLKDPEIAEVIDKSKALDKRIVYNHQVNLNETKIGKVSVPLIQNKNFIKENCAPLGNSFSQMHHKFIIIDNILWTGTYNLSFNANANNWENMMRITEMDVIEKFIGEFDKMFVFSKAIEDKLNLNRCKECGDEVEDPYEHFRIKYLTLHNNMVVIKKGSSCFYYEDRIIVTSDDHNYDSFNISSTTTSGYKAECLKNMLDFKWAECYKCKEKGIEGHMPVVYRRFVNNVKNEDDNSWTKLDSSSLITHPDKITCLECLHSIIVEESKLNSLDSTKEIKFSHSNFTEDPE